VSIIHDCDSQSIVDFPGTDLLRDKVHLKRPPGAILSKNAEYIHGSVNTRRGFTELIDPNVSIERLHNWAPGERNSILFFTRNGGTPLVKEYSQTTALTNNIATSLNAATTNCVFAEIGSRVYMAYLNSIGQGISNGKVWNGSYTGGSPDTDDLFQAPLTETTNFTVAYADPSSGVVTEGSHQFGIVFETRSGFLVKAREFNSSYAAPGAENATITLTPASTWPQWVRFGHLIMTTASNPERFFFVPGERRAIAQGTSTPTVWFADIDDTSLNGLPESAIADSYFLTLAAGELGVPSQPKFLLEYGNRMVIVQDIADVFALSKVSHVYISEPGDAQRISLDQHLIFLPGRRQVTTGFVQHKTLYLLGPSWTYALNDNNDLPSTWDKADLIDGRRGTPSPHGCVVSASGGRAWVGDRAGLYTFEGGYYSDLPASYLQTPDWKRINWEAPAGSVQMLDDADTTTVYVLAPLDSSNVPTHILAFDYRNGTDWTRVKYSLWNIASVSPGSIILFQNYSNKLVEILISDSSAGSLYRRKSTEAGDSDLYNDDGAAIDFQYTGPPVVNAQVPMQHVAAHLALKGSGTAGITAYNKNQSRSQDLGDETLTTNPEADVFVPVNEQSEALHIGVTNKNTIDSYVSLSRVIGYFRPWIERR
jgi:hypothetical protein